MGKYGHTQWVKLYQISGENNTSDMFVMAMTYFMLLLNNVTCASDIFKY